MQAILNVALPIFGIILAGYLAGRWRILGGEATGALNAFVSYFALPVLFFGTLARTPVQAVLDPALTLGFGIAVVATFVIGMLSTRLVALSTGRGGGLAAMSLQGIAASWGNVGYMGVPLCLAAFGDPGLPPAMLTVIVTAVVSMVFGVMLIELEVAAGHGPLRTFLRAAFNVRAIPCRCRSASACWSRRWACRSRRRSRNGSISWARRRRLARCSPSASSCRIGRSAAGLPKRGWPPSSSSCCSRCSRRWFCPGSSMSASVPGQVALLMAALPTAANAFVLARQFDVSVEQNSAAVLLSTAFSVITVSALLVWLHVS